MINFPATVVDNYLPEPDNFLELASSPLIKWTTDPEGRWPGERSQRINEINELLFTNIMQKFWLLFYNEEESHHVEYAADMFFQKIKPEYDRGWIHSDYPSIVTIIIYLTKNANLNTGTALYTPKNLQISSGQHEEFKRSLYTGQASGDQVKDNMEKNNSHFTQNLFVGNVYNRMFSFDSQIYHGAQDLTDSTDRLTLITFVTKLKAPCTAISRSARLPVYMEVKD